MQAKPYHVLRLARHARAAGATMLAISLSTAVWAQSIQPGLWETSSKIAGGSGEAGQKLSQLQNQTANMSPEQRKAMEQMMSPEAQKARMAQMQQQLAKLPPEQRKAMEQAMSAMSNMSMGSDGNTMIKMCITQEMIDRKDWMGKTEGKCTRTASPAVGNVQKFGFTCTDPASSGEGTLTFQNKNSYTSSMKINMVRNGKPESITFEGSSRFLGADCGAVKPITSAQK
jgi:Protein of unknown function (DUF3617)